MKKIIKIAITAVLIAAAVIMLANAWGIYRNCGNLLVLQSDSGFDAIIEKLENLLIPFTHELDENGDCRIRSRDELMPIIAETARGFAELHIEEVYREAWNTVFVLIASSAVILAVPAAALVRMFFIKRRGK